MKFIVELEAGVWLTDGEGDPPRTCQVENAKRFGTVEAFYALCDARKYRPFADAKILKCNA